MSLINDALKRAGQAHANSPATIPVGSLLQPVTATRQNASGWPVITLALLLGAVLTLMVMLFWQMTQGASSPSMVVRAPGVETAEQAASVGIPVAGLATESDGATVLQPPEPVPDPQSQVRPIDRLIPGMAPLAVNARGATVDTMPAATGMEPVPVEIEPEFRLQGLVFRPGNASALVSGKTVYEGDRVLDARVTRITRDSVVLNREGKEVVLLLD